MRGGGADVLFYESVHFFGAVDFDVGDEGEGVGEVEVFACWGSGGVCHDGTRGGGGWPVGPMGMDKELVMRCSRQHGETTCRQKGEVLDEDLF